MNIQWKNIAMALIVLILLIYLPQIINTVSGIFVQFLEATQDAWQAGIHGGHHHRGDPASAVAKMAVLGIVAVAIVKLLNKR